MAIRYRCADPNRLLAAFNQAIDNHQNGRQGPRVGALIEAATTISLAGNKKVRLAAARETMLHLVDALAGSSST